MTLGEAPSDEVILGALREEAERLLGIDPATITPEAAFEDDLGIDSMDIIEVIISMEGRFGIRSEPRDFEGVSDVAGAMGVFRRLLGP